MTVFGALSDYDSPNRFRSPPAQLRAMMHPISFI